MKSVYTFLIAAIASIVVMSPLNISSNEPLEVLQQFFQSRGFAGGDILLPHLGITVKLKKNQFYIKEENVRDIPRRINEIREIFGYKGPLPEPAPCCGWCGVVSVEYKGQEGYGYVVLVKKKINDFTHVYTHAHENGHFLWYIGKQDTIYQMFSNPGYICSQISNNDEFAELCGWLAAKRAGFDLRKCTIQNLQNRKRQSIERIKKLVWKSTE